VIATSQDSALKWCAVAISLYFTPTPGSFPWVYKDRMYIALFSQPTAMPKASTSKQVSKSSTTGQKMTADLAMKPKTGSKY
jgi:hypothetical protein